MSIAGAMQARTACYYEGRAYSLGAVAHMAGQVHMTCTLTKGEPRWVHMKPVSPLLAPV